MTTPSRRDFLRLTTRALFWLAGLLGLGGTLRFLSYKPDPGPPSEFDLGEAMYFLPNSRTIRPEIPAAIYNKSGEYSALSLACTHLGCTVEEDGEGFLCPCHGSRYNKDGLVLGGPAKGALRPLRVEKTEENRLRLYTK
jgi:Rieske Fe-S protein